MKAKSGYKKLKTKHFTKRWLKRYFAKNTSRKLYNMGVKNEEKIQNRKDK